MENLINKVKQSLGDSFEYRESSLSPKKIYDVKNIIPKDGKVLIKTNLRTFFWNVNEVDHFLKKCSKIEKKECTRSIDVVNTEKAIEAIPVFQVSDNCQIISNVLMEKFKKLSEGNVSNEFLKETREMVSISGQVIEIEKLKLMTYLKTK